MRRTYRFAVSCTVAERRLNQIEQELSGRSGDGKFESAILQLQLTALASTSQEWRRGYGFTSILLREALCEICDNLLQFRINLLCHLAFLVN